MNLSESVYGSTSVAAIGVAAHECGHAMQDASEYVPLRLRGSMVPVVNIGAQLSWPMILIGVLVGRHGDLRSFHLEFFYFPCRCCSSW